MTKKTATTEDVLRVVNDLAVMVAERFDKVEMQIFKQGEDIKALQSDVTDVKTKVDHIYSVLDSHMKRIEDILVDNKVRDHQQERLERWIFQLADKAGLKLKYD